MTSAAVTQTITSSTASAATGASATKSSSANSLDYNAFLKLLVTQMQSQDPTNPTDSTQWVSQLASFSNVEQAVQMNAKLSQILSQRSIADAEAMIGRTVTSADGKTSGKVVSVSLSDSDPVALLESGEKVSLTSGVTVS